jgi:hypothetical protein
MVNGWNLREEGSEQRSDWQAEARPTKNRSSRMGVWQPERLLYDGATTGLQRTKQEHSTEFLPMRS